MHWFYSVLLWFCCLEERGGSVNQAKIAGGYRLVQSRYLEEVGGTVSEFFHEKSGARILTIENEDRNKTFAVGFETLPEDDTGVFHILEHSVLNGSKKYPVKSSFLELMKCSMENFLNAITFQDKTVFPFATVSEKDYMNLMDVYLDTVFHPLIDSRKEIFDQEGWHFETDQTGSVSINGIVYNEMKGAFSSVDAQLSALLKRALFPGNTYRYISGGAPEAIPTLSYEAFLRTYRRFYRSDNCFMILCGKMDMKAKLEFIDREYLSAMQPGKVPIRLYKTTPVREQKVRGTYRLEKPTGRDVQSALAFYAGDFSDRERMMGIQVLLYALMGDQEAPLKKAIVDQGFGTDFLSDFSDDVLQPFVVFILKGTDPEKENDFAGGFRKIVDGICREGISRKRLMAAMNSLEFMMEQKTGMPDGIEYAIRAITGWIHGQQPLIALEYRELFQSLRGKLDGNYFETLLRELVLENQAFVQGSLFPETESPAGCGGNSVHQVLQQKLKLLDPLTVADLKTPMSILPTERQSVGPVTLLHRSAPSAGISYINYYFDLGRIKPEKMPVIQLLSELTGGLDTAKHSAGELGILMSTWLGGSGASVVCYPNQNSGDTAVKYAVRISVLERNLRYAVSLPEEFLLETLFTSEKQIRKRLIQRQFFMRQSFPDDGSYYAQLRVDSCCSLSGMCRERNSGLSYYQYLTDLLKDDAWFSKLSRELAELQRQIFQTMPLTVSFSGSDVAWTEFLAAFKGSAFAGNVSRERESRPFEDVCRPATREAFVIPSQVSHNVFGSGGTARHDDGGRLVLARFLTLEHLWKEVRMRGGAYGTNMQAPAGEGIRLSSYRDPNVRETYQVFREIPGYLAKCELSQEALLHFIIGASAQYDGVLKPESLLREYDRRWFTQESEEIREKTREELRKVTPEWIRNQQDQMAQLLHGGSVCTFGNREAIARAEGEFSQVHVLA